MKTETDPQITKLKDKAEYFNEANRLFNEGKESPAALLLERDALKQWKKEQMLVWDKVLDYGQTQAPIKAGESISAYALKCMKEIESVREANKELIQILEKAERMITMSATESYRKEIQHYLSGGYAQMIQDAAVKDSLGISAALLKHRKGE